MHKTPITLHFSSYFCAISIGTKVPKSESTFQGQKKNMCRSIEVDAFPLVLRLHILYVMRVYCLHGSDANVITINN